MTYFCHLSLTSVSAALPARNLTLFKPNDRNVAQICVQHSFSGRTHRRSQSWNK